MWGLWSSFGCRTTACVGFDHVCCGVRAGSLKARRRAPLGRVANNVVEAYRGYLGLPYRNVGQTGGGGMPTVNQDERKS